MMRKIVCVVFLMMCLGYVVKAQNYEVFNKFMKENSTNWGEGCLAPKGHTMEFVQQVGLEAPDFNFGKELNKEALKGKFVVLTFWSTWCGSCRVLAHDLDTVLFRKMEPFQDVQVIGVDCGERVSMKEAKKWWEESGISYPAVYGEAGDACQQAYRGGHPSTILVDDKGIVRSRWDGWSPSVAEMVRFSIWALKIQPAEGLSVDSVKSFMERGKYFEALYLLELMPESIENAGLKYRCKLAVSNRSAVQYFGFIQEEYAQDSNYQKLMEEVVYAIYDSNCNTEGVLRNGVDALNVLVRNRCIRDYRLRSVFGAIYCRYGECCMKAGIISLRNGLQMAEREGASADEMKRIEDLLKRYDKEK